MQELKNKIELSNWLKDLIDKTTITEGLLQIFYDMVKKRITKSRRLSLTVLYYLEKSAKLSDREIAKKIGTSQSTVTRHRNMFERNGIIKQYLTIIDESKLIKWLAVE